MTSGRRKTANRYADCYACLCTVPPGPLSQPMGEGGVGLSPPAAGAGGGGGAILPFAPGRGAERGRREATPGIERNRISVSGCVGQELGRIGEIERPQRPVKLPTLLPKEEVRQVLALVTPDHQLVCRLLYVPTLLREASTGEWL